MYHQVLKWTKKEKRKERGKGLLNWVDKRVSCNKVAFGKRSHKQGCQPTTERESWRGKQQVQRQQQALCATGRSGGRVHGARWIRGSWVEDQVRKPAEGKTMQGPLGQRGWDWTLGEQWGVGGLKDMIWHGLFCQFCGEETTTGARVEAIINKRPSDKWWEEGRRGWQVIRFWEYPGGRADRISWKDCTVGYESTDSQLTVMPRKIIGN